MRIGGRAGEITRVTPRLIHQKTYFKRFASTNRRMSTLVPQVLSKTHQGIAFEMRSLRLLEEQLSMGLRHVGGKADGGIDLQGWWWLPSAILKDPESATNLIKERPERRIRIRVLAQCKDERRKAGPNYVRELEGVLFRYLTQLRGAPTQSLATAAPDAALLATDQNPDTHDVSFWDDPSPIVGMFISSSPFTKATLLRAHTSPVPLILLHLPPLALPASPLDVGVEQDPAEEPALPTSSSEIGSLVFNVALCSSSGLLRGLVEPRWERSLTGSGATQCGRPGLWLGGKRIRSWTPDP